MDQSDGGDEGFDWDRFQSHLVKPGAGVAFDAFRSTTLALTTNSSGLKVAETLRDRLQMNFSEELIKQLNETVERQTPQPISPNTLVAEAAQGSPQIVKAVREWRALLPLADCRGGDQCLLQALVMTLRRTDGDEKAVGEAPSAKSSQTVVINVKMMRVIASPDSEYKVDDELVSKPGSSRDPNSEESLQSSAHQTRAASSDQKGSPFCEAYDTIPWKPYLRRIRVQRTDRQ
ncbi:hypothetical protein FOMPIDRAFT_1041958 [Fomitopsis schrenkii]|uniref:Uncharacterized protein n=1 Tax=Fomitopsis schrenkii TaxID=2126942 RepID=S8FE19_FOMSC|nr:hypothetical protein FOMPIDRAFT_1041958 [Fomitopsis schrenkii]